MSLHHLIRRLVAAAAFLALILAISPAAAQPPEPVDFMRPMAPIDGRRVALIIGNTDYDGAAWSILPNASNDARHIASILGDEARGAARFDVTLVTDGTREEIMAALASFAEKAAAADIAMVYFSGHGFEHNLDNYIVPVGAPGAVNESNVAQRFINMSEVVGAAAARGFSVFFLDACRERGPVLRFSSNTDGDRAALFGAIEAPQSAVFYATAMGDVAYDAAPPGSPLSPFARAVGRAMSAPGLDIPYMFTGVREAVIRATRNRDPTQGPQLAGSWSRPFYFLPAGAQPAAPPPPPPAARLDIPLETLGIVDEPVLMMRLLEQYSPRQLIAMADRGDPLALYLTGYMFAFGVGVEQDLERARGLLEQSVLTGHPAAQLELGFFLLRHGGPEGRERARSLYEQAAAQGYAKAMSHLAGAYLAGTFGVTDRDEAHRLLREAARLGHPFAHQALAIIGEDREAHVAALQALADSGDAEGSNWLCEIAAAGIHVTDSAAHCLAAARAGHSNARAHAALLYHGGIGLEPSPEKARYWARLALSSADLRDELRTRLDPLVD